MPGPWSLKRAEFSGVHHASLQKLERLVQKMGGDGSRWGRTEVADVCQYDDAQPEAGHIVDQQRDR